MNKLVHFSVMLNECMDALNLKNDGIYFDGTLGGAGHSYEILKRSAPNGKLIATDLDDYAIARGKERLKEFEGRFTIVKSNFKDFEKIKEELNIDGFDGILLDLGVSSFQLDDKERGFSYMAKDEKLDMRMDRSQKLSAETVVNDYKEEDLVKLLFEYGEEKFAKSIVKNISQKRKLKRIETCGELVQIIEESIPKKFQKEGHPAKKTFQAIRIEVNGELLALEETVIKMGRALNKNGRMAVLTFHSLEDRLVKNAFRYLECDCICDKSLPICVCDKRKEVNVITKHPIVASEEELALNSRSKSAKLRIIEKI
ncbi:MAG: 16S rRNA (cytosine(1402)-N(4))-methyltransferase RsmH [Clostridia bacterium]|nr:16S rRNA (cytosine(1402)-N(4))-methyltransferase RsmH [Clostridia bacterium]